MFYSLLVFNIFNMQTGELHNSKIREILIKSLKESKESIHLVLSYFLDNEIAEIIKQRSSSGISVEIIINDDTANSWAINELFLCNLKLHYYKPGGGRPLMYQKYCIVDGDILIAGYHNWSYAATASKHKESLVVDGEKELVSIYLKKFRNMTKSCGIGAVINFRNIQNVLRYSA